MHWMKGVDGKIPKLEQWAIVYNTAAEWTAPELIDGSLQGLVYDREGFEDGTFVRTTTLVAVDAKERTAQTESGTTYQLGEPEPGFANWMRHNDYTLEIYEKALKNER